MVNRKKQKKGKSKTTNGVKPFVSLCTPTFNRRPFFSYTIENIRNQVYPHDRMEWIIIDDGTDKVEDMVNDLSFISIKYLKFDEKMTLGKKRNMMHDHSKGDIIVYIDDDDYYPPERVSHAVDVLQKNQKALCCGSSEIYIWFKHIETMYQFGPYGPNHATAGTFAFKKELLKITRYEDDAALAEEKHFLKNYTIPFAQLDPLKTILVFSHIHNTFDKKTLIQNGENKFCKKSVKTVKMFIKDGTTRDFYMNKIEKFLKRYEPGQPKYKPDVLKQTQEIKEKREKEMQERIKSSSTGVVIQQSNGEKKMLTTEDVQQLLSNYQNQSNEMKKMIQDISFENRLLKEKNSELEKKLHDFREKEKKSTKMETIQESVTQVKSEVNVETDEDSETFIEI